jgi:hypothetical protein
MGSPLPFGGRLFWVVPLKTTHPKIIGMLVSFYLMKRQISKNNSQFFLIGSQKLSPLISQAFNIYVKSMQDIFCFFFTP